MAASLTHERQQDGQQHDEGADAGDERQQEEAQQISRHQLLRATLAHTTVGSQDLTGEGEVKRGFSITQQFRIWCEILHYSCLLGELQFLKGLTPCS